MLIALGANAGTAAAVDCLPGDNEITCENRQPGNPPSQWDVSGAGDDGIQGYATDISVDQGGTVNFKVDTASTNYRLDIYRLGYYNGDGARLIDTVEPDAPPDVQPACLDDALTGLVDCGNWAQSAAWSVPATAVSGVYIAHLVREQGPAEESHVVFIVRDDDGNSDLLVQTDDTTWQAYNRYGGNSLYTGSPAGRAYKVSYNRPFTSRGPTPEDWVFNATSPLIRWIERNGYDVSYTTGVDSHRSGAEIQEHEAFISVGHDEYWSAGQRNNVTDARNAGTDLAFFSGNEVFWKTRWENSIDGADTPHRTLVSYKTTHPPNTPDPSGEWTGTWRDNRPINPEGPNPENGLTGTMFRVNSGTSEIEVPEADGNMRLWRNTGPDGPAGLAEGDTEHLTANTLGYEWDEAPDNSSRPPGLVYNSSTTRNADDGVEVLQDNGSTYALGTATHHLTQYRDANGAGPGDDALVFGAGTIQWAWGLDGVHDRGGSTPDPDMQQATANLFADMGAQPQTLQGGLVAATASTDTAPPSSVIESPLAGNDVESGTPFEISGNANDAGGGVVGAVEVSTDDGATWHPATGRESWTYTWTPGPTGSATIRTRATDDSGNIETPSAGVTVDVICPCSIWNDSFTGPGSGDTSAVELGVRFRSDDDGFITGLRFYKTAGNTGTHIGSLWANAGGPPLATATFSGETATGWQEVSFGAPVAITADTTYVASYHAPNGNYAALNGYFESGGFDSPPLHALGDGVDGANGVYRYGAGGVFPTDTFASSNYLVDVTFEEDVGPDTTPPTITGRTPANGANGVATGTDVTATFNEPMDTATINATNVELRDPGNALVPATVTYNPANRRATLDPDANLQNSTTYTATVKGGPGGVEDDADPGNPLAADSTWSFTIAAPPPPPPDEGPGGPILVISDSSNPFGRYYAEILRSEGLNEFTVTDRSLVTPAILNAHDVVVLGETGLSAAQVTMLDTWVNAGGNLIAMRPDPQLAGLLGLTDTPDTLANAYIQVDTGSPPGAGIVGQTMQFHSTADRYTPNGAQTVATLYSDASTPTPNPAVTLEDVGGNGGQAAAFTYDLARSVVYTRQGNPAWSGDERDSAVGGSQLIRSDDLFYGAKPGDVQPDWVDLNKVAIPQADEQQHLLTNLIQRMNLDRKPLPKFWFLPRDEKAAVVLTGDDHASGGTEGQFNTYQAANPGCSVAEWECVRGTSYIYPNTSSLTDAEADAFESAGFEIALHVNTNCENWTSQAQLEGFYTSQLASFAANYPSLDAATTNRTHCIAWSDWATQPKVELQNGIRLDTNYYYWPSAWVQNRPGMFTGSGLPQRFADLDGSMIDVYQAATQMNDEADQTYPYNIDTLLDNALGPQGYYGVFTANMHTDAPSHSGANAIIASAGARDVPVVSARQMLEWLDGRNGSSFGSLSWNANKLNFNISVGAGANGLRAMVPTTSSVGALTGVKLGSTPLTTTTRTIKGVEYAFFDAAPGAYEAAYAVDDTPPSITNVAHSPQTNGTANVTWDTNEASDSRVDYGTNPSNLNQSQSSSGLVTSHNLQLTGLAPNTTYHYRVTSSDAASNSTTDPNPPAAPRSFTTPSTSFIDTTVSDFSAGTTGPNTYVSETGDGEVTLKPTEGQEFSGGPGQPPGWTGCTWPACSPGSAPGPATVSGGSLHVNGGMANTNATYGPGRAVEFKATFGAAHFQHLAFTDNFNSAWAMFSTRNDAGQVYASTNNPTPGNGLEDFAIPGSSGWIGTPHLYRIEWDTTEVRYLVDGILVHTRALGTPFGPNLNLAVSDFDTGGPELAVDWVRMSPYPASGTFESRVFDAGQAADWGALTWASAVPVGTSLAMSVRTGNNPTPDGTWSAFTPIGSSGADIPGNSRYVQYRAQLAATDAARTPTLSEVSIAFAAGADLTPPTIANRTPAPNATNVARNTNVDVQFSEAMNPATITASTVRLRKQGAGADVPASVSYSGNTATIDPTTDLDPGAVYDVTVKGGAGGVADAADNELAADDTWSFTTVPFTFVDDTTAEFGAGTPGADTYVSETDDGEVTLKPTEGAEFEGASIPGGWRSCPWSDPTPEDCDPGTGGTVSGGSLHLDGAYAKTIATYTSGRSLEFVANFGGENNQHVGFGVDLNNSANWAIFSRKFDGTFNARTMNGGSETTMPLSGSLFNSPHLYRIEWDTNEVRYYVDGTLVATHAATFGATQMRPIATDLTPGGPEVSVDWMRMSPYPASGTFDSRIFDAGAGQVADWGALNWDSTTPPGTGIALSVRTGNTPTPDLTWSGFTAIGTNGGDIPGSSRYVQYRAQLTTSDNTRTPTLSQVSIGYVAGADVTAPTIANRTPAPNATDVARNTNVDVQFSEAMNPATINASTVRLRKQGAGADVPASVSYSGNTATIDPTTDLDPGAVYDVTVKGGAGGVADAAGNELAADDTWSFTTAPLSFNFIDTTVSDFSAGTPGTDTYVSKTDDGEVTLKPTVGEEFSDGPGLPGGWEGAAWGGGGAVTVSGDALHANGAYARTTAFYGSGRSLEYVANFAATPFETVGFANDLNAAPWATFSTTAGGGTLFTRTDNGQLGGQLETNLGGGLLGSSHLYRIEWDTNEVRFYVDGGLVATHAVTFGATQMRPIASEFNDSGPEVTVDWMRMSPYPASGTFDSRIFDAGASQVADWGALNWDSTTPPGTGIALSVRTGNTPTPDLTWSGFTAIGTNGGDIPGSSRYVQYRAQLTTSDNTRTPTLSRVEVNGVQATPPPGAPTITATDPPSPANNNDPKVQGTVGAGDPTQAKIWKNATCADAPDATGTVAQFTGAGITVNVGNDTTTALSAKVSNAGGDSTCSNTIDYVEDSTAPQTTIDSAPHGATNDPTPSFEFSSSQPGPGSSFQCSIDTGTPDFQPCTSPHTAAALADGDYSFRVRATDEAGNTDASPAVEAFTVDTAGPQTTIDSAPHGATNDPTPSFEFSSSQPGPGSSFQCSIDTGTPDFQPCTSPHTAAALADGDYSFRVRATDEAGNTDASPAVEAFTVDTAGPQTTIDSAPHGATNDPTPSFEFSSSQPGPGSSFQCSIDTGTPDFQPCTSPHTAAALADGDYSFRVRATDEAGNTDASPAVEAFTVDTAGPQTTIDSAPHGATNDPTPSFEFSSSQPGPGSSFQCSIDTGTPDFQPCTSPHTAAALADGDYSFRVRATDEAGNTDASPAVEAFTVDTAGPQTTIDSAPHGATNDPTPSFEFSSSQPGPGSSFQCSIDTGTPDFQPCTSPHTAAALADGDYSFRVRATDEAGNTDASPAVEAFTVDTAGPQTTIDSAPHGATNDPTPSFEFSSSQPGPGSSFQCSIDTGTPDFQPCTSPHTAAALADGDYSFRVRATDEAGNTDASPAVEAFTVDTAGPQTTIDSAPHGATNDPTPSFEFSSSQPGPGSSFQCSIDTGTPDFQPCTSPHTAAALADGDYSFRVRATDEAGNTDASPAVEAFTVDTAGPQTTIDSAPHGATNDPTPSFEFSSSQPGPGSSFQCSIDTGTPDFQPCTSPHTAAALADGDYSFRVRATDEAGNTDASPAVEAFTVDTAGPQTTIDSAPHGATNDPTPSFEFSSSQPGPGSSFQCSIDTGTPDFQPCTSPHTAAALADGDYSFRVRATDEAGNTDASPAVEAFTVDTAGPQTTIDSAPHGATNDPTPSFEFSSSQPGPGSSFQCSIDTGTPDFQPCTSPHTAAALADGDYSFRVRATDEAGNTDASPAVEAFTVDTAGPQTTIDSAPHGATNDPTPSFEFSSSQPGPGSSFQCSIDTGTPDFQPCTSPHTAAALADGDYSFRVRATDEAGNTDASPAVEAFTVDTAGPQTTIDSAPHGATNDPTPSFEFSSSQPGPGSSFQCSIDTGTPDFQPCTSPHTAAALADGDYSFRVRATDEAGNTDASPAVEAFTVDTAGPQTTIDSAPHGATNDPTPSFEFSSSQPGPGSSFQCSIDTGTPDFQPCTSPHTAAALADGDYSFRVRATDEAGNTDASPAVEAFTVDTAGPQTTIDSAPHGATNDPTPSFEFSSSQPGPGSSFQCSIDTGTPDFQPCTSPHTAAALADGDYSFRVRATDEAGNTDASPAVEAFTVDTAGPQTTIDSAPHGATNDPTPSFEFSSSQPGPGSSFQCSIDTGTPDFQPCTSPHTAAALADGDYSFRVRATDEAGNTDASPAVEAFTVDTAGPQTTIDSAPHGATNDPTPSFEFSSSQPGPGSSFQCSIDTGTPDFQPCTSPHTAAALADGDYSFRVRATDEAGNTDASPAVEAFTVDTAGPQTTIDSAPHGATNDPTPSFEFSSSQPGPGSSFQCSIDTGTPDFQPCTSPHTAAALADGDYSFRVRATDEAGNTDASPAVEAFTVDTAGPQTTIDSAPHGATNDPTPSFEFSSSQPGPGSSFQCSIDTGTPDFQPCTSPHTAAALADGDYSFRVRATDEAGNTDASPAVEAFTVDTAGPQTTIDSAPHGATNDPTPSFEFSSSQPGPGSSFQCSIDTGTPDFQPCTSPHTAAALADGDYSFRVRATDEAGNTDASPAVEAFTVDTAGPDAPSIEDSDPNSPANDINPELKGSAEDGSTVRIYQSGNCLGPIAAEGSAADFASPGLTVTVADDSDNSFTATASDAGNTSECSAPFSYTEDSTGPAAPTVTTTAPPSPANDNNPEVKGTVAGGAPTQVKLYKNVTCAGAPDATGTVAAFTGAGITVNVVDNSTTALSARTADQAGNDSVCSNTINYVEDSNGPAAPTINDSDPNSPANDNNPELRGTAENDSTVRIYEAPTAADCVPANLAAIGSEDDFSAAGLTPNVAADSITTFRATATDAAGNTSVCSAAFNYVEDSTGPAAPTVTTTAPPSPANDNNPEVKGTVAGGSPTQVKLYENATCAGAPDATGTVAAFTGAGITVNVPDNSTTALSARTADQVGNDSSCSNTINYVENSNSPAPPTINDSDPNSPANDNNPEIKGSAAAGSTVRLYQSGNCTGAIEAQGSAAQFASPGLTATVANNSTNAFTATATDAAGNTSTCSAAFNYVEDSSGPARPTINDSDPNSPANDNNPEIKGSAAAGSTVRLYQSGNCSGAIEAQGSAAQFASPGLTATVANNSTNAFTATATDAAGNTSTCSAAFNYVEDSSGPARPTINDSDPNSPANDNNPEIKGSAAAGSTVRLYQSGNCSGAIEAQGSAAQFASPGLTATVANNSTNAFTATATDAAGNTSTCSAAFNYVEDSSGPARPTINDSDPNSPANDNNPEIKGSAAAGSTVRLYQSGNCSGAIEAQGSAAQFASPGLTATVANNSTNAFTATATDAAGNTSTCSAAFNYREDSTPPQTTITSGPSGNTRDRTPTFRFTSSEPSGDTFQCRVDGASFSACSSPKTLSTLSFGNHTFRVRAIDQAGNVDPTPAVRTFTVVR